MDMQSLIKSLKYYGVLFIKGVLLMYLIMFILFGLFFGLSELLIYINN